MTLPSSDFVYQQIVESKGTLKYRLEALRNIEFPTLIMLLRLMRNPSTPFRLKALAAKRYQQAMELREKCAIQRKKKQQSEA